MADDREFVVRYGAESKICTFLSTRRSDYWSNNDINDKFNKLFVLIGEKRIKSKCKIEGNMKKKHKAVFILVCKAFLESIVKNHPEWTAVISTDQQVDFEKVFNDTNWPILKPMVVTCLISKFLCKHLEGIFHEFALQHEDHVMGEWYTKHSVSINMLIEVLKNPDGEDGFVYLSPPDSIEIVPQEIPLPPAPQEQIVKEQNKQQNPESFVGMFKDKLQPFMLTLLPSATTFTDDTFLSVWKGDADEEMSKKLLFYACMLTYYRRYAYQSPSALLLQTKDKTYKQLVNEFKNNINAWVTPRSPPSYIIKVKEYIEKLDGMIIKQNFKELIKEVESLRNRWGFKYGVKLLSFVQEGDTKAELSGKKNGKLVYPIKILRKYKQDIVPRECPENADKYTLINTIGKNNPHTIHNAVSFFTDENLLDLHPNLFVKLKMSSDQYNFSYIAFDVTELATLIVSSKGKNEHMGLPDLPQKGKIWHTKEDLRAILAKILYIADEGSDPETKKILADAERDMNNGVKATMDGKSVHEIASELNKLNWKMYVEDDSLLSTRFSYLLSDLIGEKDPTAREEKYAALAVLYCIARAEVEKFAEFKELLKDINVLHLVGLVGWLMLSDKATSHSQNADDFKITEECKNIFEKYILTLEGLRDKDEDEKYYYYHENDQALVFNKRRLIEKLKTLSFNGQSIDSIMNTPSCNHGIGGNLINVYLKTLHDLNHAIDAGAIKENEIPFYLTRDRLKPLPIFKSTGNGVYVYLAKHVADKVRDVFGQGDPYDNVTDNGDHLYSIQYCDVLSGSRAWCGKITYHVNNLTHNDTQFDYKSLRNRTYNRATNTFEYVPQSVQTFFTGHYTRTEVAQLVRATDLFTQHRIEHFRIYARYVIDFSNMLQEYYEKGIITENGQFNADMVTDDDVQYGEWPETPLYQSNAQDYIKYVYAYHLGYTDKDDIVSDLKSKLPYAMNVNAEVGRDYKFENGKGIKMSKLTYFHDMLGKYSEIYTDEVRDGSKSVYGIMTEITRDGGKDKLGDVMMQKLNRSGQSTTFNQLVIKKAMMSKALLKFMDPQAINPYFMNVTDNIKDDQEKQNVFSRTKNYAVDRYVNYLNLGNLQFTPKAGVALIDDKDKIRLAFGLSLVYYTFLYSIVQKSIVPSMANMPEYLPIANIINKNFFELPFDLLNELNTNIRTIYSNIINQDELEMMIEDMKKIHKAAYDGLFSFLSMFFDPLIPTTYNYSIINMMTFKPIIETIKPYLETQQGFEKLQKIVRGEAPDENNILDIFTTSEKLFPDKAYAINNREAFLSELVDLTCKYDVLSSITVPLQALNNIFDRIAEVNTLPVFDLASPNNELVDAANEFEGVFYQDMIDSVMMLPLCGVENQNNMKGDINILVKHILEGLTKLRFHNFGQLLISTMCICAYENSNWYVNSNDAVAINHPPPPRRQEMADREADPGFRLSEMLAWQLQNEIPVDFRFPGGDEGNGDGVAPLPVDFGFPRGDEGNGAGVAPQRDWDFGEVRQEGNQQNPHPNGWDFVNIMQGNRAVVGEQPNPQLPNGIPIPVPVVVPPNQPIRRRNGEGDVALRVREILQQQDLGLLGPAPANPDEGQQ